MENSDLKNDNLLLTRYFTIQKMWGLSNEILCNRVAQGAAKLLEVKVGCLKKPDILIQPLHFTKNAKLSGWYWPFFPTSQISL